MISTSRFLIDFEAVQPPQALNAVGGGKKPIFGLIFDKTQTSYNTFISKRYMLEMLKSNKIIYIFFVQLPF